MAPTLWCAVHNDWFWVPTDQLCDASTIHLHVVLLLLDFKEGLPGRQISKPPRVFQIKSGPPRSARHAGPMQGGHNNEFEPIFDAFGMQLGTQQVHVHLCLPSNMIKRDSSCVTQSLPTLQSGSELDNNARTARCAAACRA